MRLRSFLAAWILLSAAAPVGAQADESLTFEDVKKARPADIRKPFTRMTVPQLVALLNDNLETHRIRTAGCDIEWEWTVTPSSEIPYDRLKVRVDSHQIEFGGGEVLRGRLLYHPESQGDHFIVLAPDGKVLLKQSWHTLEIRDAQPAAYWRVAGGFWVLAEKVAAECRKPPK
jgi:hypothetical protein